MSEHLALVEIARLCDESLERSVRRRGQGRKVRWVRAVAVLFVAAAVLGYVYAR